jgi:hypothetical protein
VESHHQSFPDRQLVVLAEIFFHHNKLEVLG